MISRSPSITFLRTIKHPWAFLTFVFGIFPLICAIFIAIMVHYWLGISAIFYSVMFIFKSPLTIYVTAFPLHHVACSIDKSLEPGDTLLLIFTGYWYIILFIYTISDVVQDLFSSLGVRPLSFPSSTKCTVEAILFISLEIILARIHFVYYYLVVKKPLPLTSKARLLFAVLVYIVGNVIVIFYAETSLAVLNVVFALMCIIWVVVIDTGLEIAGEKIVRDFSVASFLALFLISGPVLFGTSYKAITSLVKDGTGIVKLGPVLLWSFVMGLTNLVFFLLAKRCLEPRYQPIPLYLAQLLTDLFTELLFLEFSLTKWTFWAFLIGSMIVNTMRLTGLIVDLRLWIKIKAVEVGFVKDSQYSNTTNSNPINSTNSTFNNNLTNNSSHHPDPELKPASVSKIELTPLPTRATANSNTSTDMSSSPTSNTAVVANSPLHIHSQADSSPTMPFKGAAFAAAVNNPVGPIHPVVGISTLECEAVVDSESALSSYTSDSTEPNKRVLAAQPPNPTENLEAVYLADTTVHPTISWATLFARDSSSSNVWWSKEDIENSSKSPVTKNVTVLRSVATVKSANVVAVAGPANIDRVVLSEKGLVENPQESSALDQIFNEREEIQSERMLQVQSATAQLITPVVVLAVVVLDMLYVAADPNFRGASTITRNMSPSRRGVAALVYCVTLGSKVIVLATSRYIIQNKNWFLPKSLIEFASKKTCDTLQPQQRHRVEHDDDSTVIPVTILAATKSTGTAASRREGKGEGGREVRVSDGDDDSVFVLSVEYVAAHVRLHVRFYIAVTFIVIFEAVTQVSALNFN